MIINIEKYIPTILALDQIYILSKYLGINELDIHYCLKSTSNKIKNPLRDDKHASLGIMYIASKYGDKLYVKDFGDDYYTGDIFQLVGLSLNKDSNNKEDFKTICKHILANYHSTNVGFCAPNKFIGAKSKQLTYIEVEIRDWLKQDDYYWRQFGLTRFDLEKNHVYPVFRAYVGTTIYTSTLSDICYAYYLGTNDGMTLYQLYFPYRTKDCGRPRFITNNRHRILSLLNFNSNAQNLLVLKSRKDEIFLWTHILLYYGAHMSNPVSTFALSTESGSKLTSNDISLLNKTNIRRKFIFLDNDKSGIATMKYHRDEYGFIPIFLPRGTKDITDYCKKFGLEKTKLLAQEYINALIDNYE